MLINKIIMFKRCFYAGSTCSCGPEPSCSWSYGSLIDNYIGNQCLSLLTLWVRIALRRCVLDTTLCDKVWQWLATGRWFSLETSVSSTNTADLHDHEITWKWRQNHYLNSLMRAFRSLKQFGFVFIFSNSV
jgi:hypothetical protein